MTTRDRLIRKRFMGRAVLVIALLTALAAPAFAQSALDRIRERGVITIGYIDGAAPFSFAGDDKVGSPGTELEFAL